MPEKFKKVIWPPSTQLAPVPAVLVGCGGECGYRNNLITIAWAGIVNSDKPMLSISVRPARYSNAIIRETGVFSVNIPTAGMAREVDYCGVTSGRDVDKFTAAKLTPVKGSQTGAPLVAECPLNLECRTHQIIPLGSHELFIAEIVAVQAQEELIDASGKFDLPRAGLLAYAHGGYYGLGEYIGHFGFSVRKDAAKNK